MFILNHICVIKKIQGSLVFQFSLGHCQVPWVFICNTCTLLFNRCDLIRNQWLIINIESRVNGLFSIKKKGKLKIHHTKGFNWLSNTPENLKIELLNWSDQFKFWGFASFNFSFIGKWKSQMTVRVGLILSELCCSSYFLFIFISYVYLQLYT